MSSTRDLDRMLIEEARKLLGTGTTIDSANGKYAQTLLLVAQASTSARQTKYIFWSLLVLAAGTVANVLIALYK
jgi:hypothetical protein